MELIIKLIESFNFSIFSVLFFSVFALVCKYFRTGYRRAPGPMGLPFVGYYPFLRDNFPKHMDKLSKQYGPVFRINIGSKELIMLSSFKVVREAFKTSHFSGRPASKLYDMFQGYGITNIDGAPWKAQRKFLHTQLRSLGMKIVGTNNEKLEQNIMEELMPLLSAMKASGGKPFNPNKHFTLMASNILSEVLMSNKFTSDDTDYRKMAQLNKEGFELFAKADLTTNMPFLRYIPKYGDAFSQLKEHFLAEQNIIRQYVTKARKNFDPELQPNNIVQSYLHSEHRSRLEGKHVVEADTDRQIVQVLMDLYSGGSETTKTSFNWIFLLLLHYPDVAKKIQEEMDSEVGRDRLPTLSDMLNLTYTRAVISEMLRFVTIVPLVMHSAVEDTSVGGYFVPKGTVVFANIYSCHSDPKLFPSPEKFIPERFIDIDNRYHRPEGFMAFGWGQRICLGEIMAKCELFLLVACTLHSFNLAKPEDSEIPDLKEVFILSNSPKPYEIRFLPRKDILPEIDERP